MYPLNIILMLYMYTGSIYRIFEEGKQFQVEQLGAHDGLVNTLTRADLKMQYKYFQ